jgi:hypothetical protein
MLAELGTDIPHPDFPFPGYRLLARAPLAKGAGPSHARP